jgi:hypothetical protein
MKHWLALCGLATLLGSHLAWADPKPVTTTTTLSTSSNTTTANGKTTASTNTTKTSTTTTSTAKESVEKTVQENDSLKELCNTYADEDKIAAAERDTYIKKCLSQMTDLSEGMQESVPLVSDNETDSTAAPSSRKVNDDPEALIKSELVDAPTPGAEQLDSAPKAN